MAALTDGTALTAWFWPPRLHPRATWTRPVRADRQTALAVRGRTWNRWRRTGWLHLAVGRRGRPDLDGHRRTVRSGRWRPAGPAHEGSPTPRPGTRTIAGWTDCLDCRALPSGSPSPDGSRSNYRTRSNATRRQIDPSPDVRPAPPPLTWPGGAARSECADGGLPAHAPGPTGRTPLGLGEARPGHPARGDRPGRGGRGAAGARPTAARRRRWSGTPSTGTTVIRRHVDLLRGRVRARPAPRRPAAQPAQRLELGPGHHRPTRSTCARQIGPPRHDTIALHEMHTLGPDGLPAEHQTIQVIKSTVDIARRPTRTGSTPTSWWSRWSGAGTSATCTG